MFHVSHTTIRRLTVVAAVLVAVAVASPLASAKRRSSTSCEPTPAHWISVTDDLGIPSLELVPGTRCTDAVATTDSCGPRSPYPGWVQVTDDLGIPYLFPTGSAATIPSCPVSSSTTTTAVTTQSAASQPMASPYPGWVVVLDDLGVPWLEAISSYR